jgi:AraC-like DNA-binding protein
LNGTYPGPVPHASSYVEEPPVAGAAAAHLDCVWVGEVGDDAGYTDRVLPDACIDVIWDGARVFVAGPDTGPVIVRNEPGAFVTGVRFKPGHAGVVLGVPVSELRDLRVDARELWGRGSTASLEDELAEAPSHGHAARALEQYVSSIAVDLELRHADAVRRRSLGAASVEEIADDLGVTTRTLHRTCLGTFGYGPKTLQRVLRFRTFLSLAEQSPSANLARLASDAGYADQPHLTRESLRLSGLTPAALLTSRSVRSVQD